MLNFIESEDIAHESATEQQSEMTETTNRRSEDRTKAVFRPCCILHDKRAQIGTIRNISAGGAQIRTSLMLKIGDRISYFWDGFGNTLAEVAWNKGDIYGLRNVTTPDAMIGDFPRRSVRIPCEASAFAWSNEGMKTLEIANISMSGMLVAGSTDIAPGSLFTVKLGLVSVPNCTVRWTVDGMVGIRFGRMLTMKELSMFLAKYEEASTSSEQIQRNSTLENFVRLSSSSPENDLTLS